MAEAEKRDHRKINKKLDLYHMQEEAPGSIFWHPKGWSVYSAIEEYMRGKQRAQGYQEIKTPQIVDMSLWEKSGHADKFGDDMFSLQTEDRTYAVKPMNCPCHVQVFNQGLKSYRDLPCVWRSLVPVTAMSRRGHCTALCACAPLLRMMRISSVLKSRFSRKCRSLLISFTRFMQTLAFDEIIYRLSTRPPERVGSDEDWDRAEAALGQALDAKELPWQELPGEGAFYGPKIEFSLKDCIGRVWQLGTIQVDFSMPGRLEAQYVAEDGSRQVPVMLHRAILGSFERFIGILIEQYEGAFPFWLAPEQAVVMNITDSQADYAQEVAKSLQNNGFRAICDLRNEKIGFKIRGHSMQRVPYILVVGDKEKESRTVAVRTRDGKDLGSLPLEQVLTMFSEETEQRGRICVEETE